MDLKSRVRAATSCGVKCQFPCPDTLPPAPAVCVGAVGSAEQHRMGICSLLIRLSKSQSTFLVHWLGFLSPRGLWAVLRVVWVATRGATAPQPLPHSAGLVLTQVLQTC